MSTDLARRIPEEVGASRRALSTRLTGIAQTKRLDFCGYFETNNNRMEFRACVFVHEWILRQKEQLGVDHVQVVTDSKYVYDNYNRCIGWSRNGWRNFHERPVENVDLWKQLLRVRRKLGGLIRVQMQLIKGKSTPIAKEVDRAAKVASKLPSRVDLTFPIGKVGRNKNSTSAAAQMFPAAGRILSFACIRQ